MILPILRIIICKLVPEVYFYNDSVFKIDTSFRKRDFLSFSSGD